MTIDQQIRDRFDRETRGDIPEPDLAAAISGGRRRRRLRLGGYAAGAAAVALVGASVLVAPHLGSSDTVRLDQTPATGGLPPADVSFVPGTDIDENLETAIAAALPALPGATDVYPSDWSRDTPLPDEDFADATEWQAVYDLSAADQLLVYVTKPIPGVDGTPGCGGGSRVDPRVPPVDCVETQVDGGTLVGTTQIVGDKPDLSYWFLAEYEAADGRFVNVIEQLDAASFSDAVVARVLSDTQLAKLAVAPGLEFPDPVNPPPAQ